MLATATGSALQLLQALIDSAPSTPVLGGRRVAGRALAAGAVAGLAAGAS